MELWIGGETEQGIYADFAQTRRDVRDTVNAAIRGRTYDIPLDGWDVIPIIRDDDRFGEVVKYTKRDREMDFRLRIDHASFRHADAAGKRALLVRLLLRSLDILGEKIGRTQGIDDLSKDVRSVARQHQWE